MTPLLFGYARDHISTITLINEQTIHLVFSCALARRAGGEEISVAAFMVGAELKKLGWLVLGTGLLVGPVEASQVAHYKINPEQVADSLTGLRVRFSLPARPGGQIVLNVPNGLRSRLAPSGITLDGGRWADNSLDSPTMTIKATSSRISVTYRLLSDGDKGTRANGQETAIHANWFAVRGDDILITPTGAGTASMDVASVDGWTIASNLTKPVALTDVGDSQILGGKNYRLLTRKVGGTVVRVIYPEGLTGQVEALSDDAAKLVDAETAFWRTTPEPVLVGLVELKDESEFSGRGFRGGFSLYLGKSVDRAAWGRLIAHEKLHGWISRAIGGFPERDDDLEAWLHEGFTEAYTGRMLRAAGLWTWQDYIEDWNQALARYGTSPVKTAPNSRILADRNRDAFVNRLPYDRGRLLAVMWDHVFREHTGGHIGLDEVLRAQMAEAADNVRHGKKISADRLFPVVVKQLTGLDISADIKRYVDGGAPIAVNNNVFGPCIRVVSVTQPVFDRGFDMEATYRAHGRITDLEPGGPAERAGLKAGDRIHIDEMPTNDSRVTLSYKVDDPGGKNHVVSYRPEGSDTISFQQLAPEPTVCRMDRF